MVTAVAAWSIWGSDVFPAEEDPTGSMLRKRPFFTMPFPLTPPDPDDWTENELRRWLRTVSWLSLSL